MTILELNPDIVSKTAFIIPTLFGELKYDKRRLFSYSIYESNIVKEVRFCDRKVIIYAFGENKFLSSINIYEGDKKYKINIELIEKTETEIKFRDWSPGNGDGNHGTLEILDSGLTRNLRFPRVDSFLGYKMKATFKCNDSGMFLEEHYSQWNDTTKSYKLKMILSNEYTMKTNMVDTLAREILSNGWPTNNKVLNKICDQ